MSKQTKAWARKARAQLMRLLGAACARCGATEALTFDCIEPAGDEHHRGSTDQRMCFYRQQHFGYANVQVLCETCNARKGDEAVRYPRFELERDSPGRRRGRRTREQPF